jgi:DNA-binding response OmpR family regulator
MYETRLFTLRKRPVRLFGQGSFERMGRIEMPSELLKVIVVEDDASMGRAIERILRAEGFAAFVFASAEAALEANAAASADCLILDIHLPGMSGFDLHRRLALSGQETPTIFMTARDEPAVRDEAQKLGGAGSYVPKPFSGSALLDAVGRALRRH